MKLYLHLLLERETIDSYDEQGLLPDQAHAHQADQATLSNQGASTGDSARATEAARAVRRHKHVRPALGLAEGSYHRGSPPVISYDRNS